MVFILSLTCKKETSRCSKGVLRGSRYVQFSASCVVVLVVENLFLLSSRPPQSVCSLRLGASSPLSECQAFQHIWQCSFSLRIQAGDIKCRRHTLTDVHLLHTRHTPVISLWRDTRPPPASGREAPRLHQVIVLGCLPVPQVWSSVSSALLQVSCSWPRAPAFRWLKAAEQPILTLRNLAKYPRWLDERKFWNLNLVGK